MPLFFNDHLTVNSKNIFLPELYKKGLRLVKDVLDETGNCISLASIKNTIGNKKLLIILWTMKYNKGFPCKDKYFKNKKYAYWLS